MDAITEFITRENAHRRRALAHKQIPHLVLRHQSEVIGLHLDDEGWLDIDALVAAAIKRGKPLTLELVHEAIATNDKQRFALSDDGLRIRANQRHSVVGIDLNLSEASPPDVLYHGTVAAFIERVRSGGL